MLDVVLDTSYWIELKEDPDALQAFRQTKEAHELRVYFTRPNFTDLAKAEEQDRLSRILADTVDLYMVIEDFNSDEYYHSENPLLIGEPGDREYLARHTEDFGEEKTLKFMFRIYDQEPDQDYPVIAEKLRDLYREHGEGYLETATFWRYVETTDTGGSRLDFSNVTALSYVRRKLKSEHAKQLQPNENVRFQDRIDIELCTYAIAVADVFVVEEKWVNQGIIPAVLNDLEGDDPPVLVTSLGELFETVPDLSTT